jgi:peptide/nickel transport system permease protein
MADAAVALSDAPEPVAPTPEPPALSQARAVLRRLAKNRVAIGGLYAVVGLVLLAVAAPLIALNQPFYWNTGQGAEFPWLRALFNRLLFENSVDLLFNLVLVSAPFVGLALLLRAWLGARWSVPQLVGRYFAIVSVLFAASSVGQLGSSDNPLHFMEQVRNYRLERERLVELGQPPVAWFPPLPFSYRETDPTHSLESPNGTHWLGTDTEGRDVFCRMLYGTRISLTIGVVAVAIYIAIGVALGALAGYFGGWVDMLVSRLIEVMITFPSFFLILTLAALIERRSIFHVMLIIGLTRWTGVARLVRAEFLRQKNLDYVQAALAMGFRSGRVIFLHILPNAVAPALVSATFGIASAILIESSLSFLGVGDLSVASWGETLNTGRVQQKLWLVLAPGAAIFFVVTVFNLLGEGIRDALDPKLRV